MTVHNTEKYVAQAVSSILHQTFKDFEFIIIDDGSTDNSVSIIESFTDRRIRFYKSSSNLGLTTQLNNAISYAQGRYLARMDADDISLPNRLNEQVEFLDQNLDVGLCGAFSQTFDDKRNFNRTILPATHDSICAFLLFGNPIVHPTIMFRKDIIDKYKIIYPSEVRVGQDFALYALLYQKTKLANIPKVLLKYRTHQTSITRLHDKEQHELGVKVKFKLLRFFFINCDEFELEEFSRKHLSFIENRISSKSDFEKFMEWMSFLAMHNQKHGFYNQSQFLNGLGHVIYRKLVRDQFYSFTCLWFLLSTHRSFVVSLPAKYKLVFVTRCFLNLLK